MARKRFVTSEISTDKKLGTMAEENPTAALMWPWFITNFDDWGRMAADPMEVKLTIFPAFPFTSKDIAEAIKLYDKFSLAYYYEVDGKPYLAVNPDTYYKYQTYIKADRKEKQKSKYPAPPCPPWGQSENIMEESTIVADNQQTSADIVLSPSPSPSPSPSKEKASKINLLLPQCYLSEGGSGGKQFGGCGGSDRYNACNLFEQEFGRTLTPLEIQNIQDLEKDFGSELIYEAVSRAVSQGKVTIKYVKGILSKWRRSGVKNIHEAMEYENAFEKSKASKQVINGSFGGPGGQIRPPTTSLPDEQIHNPKSKKKGDEKRKMVRSLYFRH